MITYPSIPHITDDCVGKSVIAFDKLDGSNMSFEWKRKKGWVGYSSRYVRQTDEKLFKLGWELFQAKYGQQLTELMTKKGFRYVDTAVVFGEIYGENSFAGQHVDTDKMNLTIFDMRVADWVHPNILRELGIELPEIVFEGIFTQDVVNQIKSSRSLKEGVIVRWTDNRKQYRGKLKTTAWLDRLVRERGQEALKEEFGMTA